MGTSALDTWFIRVHVVTSSNGYRLTAMSRTYVFAELQGWISHTGPTICIALCPRGVPTFQSNFF